MATEINCVTNRHLAGHQKVHKLKHFSYTSMYEPQHAKF